MGGSELTHAPTGGANERKAAHIQRLLEPGAIQPVYQPIVRLTDLVPIGYEGLARFPYVEGLSHLPPDVTLAAAGELGLRQDLEVACWAAMAAAGSPPGGRLLFANISPDALGHPRLYALAERLPSRLVIEITEQSEVEDYDELRERLAPWQLRGASLAIDDTGAGYASLQHVVEMRPDFLKLSRALVAHIDRDSNRQALLGALTAFAREVGARIVAEGVERPEELEILRENQVDFAQGWIFGMPGAPWPEIPELDERPSKPGLTESGMRRLGSLEREVVGAASPKAVCDAVVAHLAGQGLMPSIYLDQGGRLRCVSARGYWQIFDGMPVEAGVVGRSFRTGEVTVISDVAKVPEYLSMVPAVKAEIAVPVKSGDRIVAVINVESPAPLGEAPRREIERAAALLGRRLAEFGTLDRPSAGQRLARAATRAAAMLEPADVIAEAAVAALDVAGMESVAMVTRDERGRLHVTHATGPFAETFRDLGVGELGAMASWIEAGTTVMTVGDPAGKGPTATDALRRAGAGGMVIVPLAVSGVQLGFIALADRSSVVLATEETELLELLGVQAAAQLRGLAAVEQLRDRASRDPLTGLGHTATFHARLPRRREETARAGRQLAVLLADVDGFKAINDRRGMTGGDAILRDVAALLEEIAPAGSSAYRVGADEFALVVEAPDRGEVQQIAWRLQAQARDRLNGTTLSIGVAIAHEGETEAQLLARAHAAVVEVKRRGRDGVAVAA